MSQSLLKERRRPPTGGLSEALEESLGRGVSTPPSSIVGSKTTPGASEVGFSSSRRKGLVTALRGIAPIGIAPIGACGDHERAYSGRVQNPENLLRCLF